MNLAEMRDHNGQLPAHVWPGGYQMIYITKDGQVVCPACANAERDDPPIAGDVFWEGPAIECDDCGKRIESSYGDPEAQSWIVYAVERSDDNGQTWHDAGYRHQVKLTEARYLRTVSRCMHAASIRWRVATLTVTADNRA